jgi:hypothetical protein
MLRSCFVFASSPGASICACTIASKRSASSGSSSSNTWYGSFFMVSIAAPPSRTVPFDDLGRKRRRTPYLSVGCHRVPSISLCAPVAVRTRGPRWAAPFGNSTRHRASGLPTHCSRQDDTPGHRKPRPDTQHAEGSSGAAQATLGSSARKSVGGFNSPVSHRSNDLGPLDPVARRVTR